MTCSRTFCLVEALEIFVSEVPTLMAQVNGQDILAVREATKYCADYIRAGKVGLGGVAT